MWMALLTLANNACNTSNTDNACEWHCLHEQITQTTHIMHVNAIIWLSKQHKQHLKRMWMSWCNRTNNTSNTHNSCGYHYLTQQITQATRIMHVNVIIWPGKHYKQHLKCMWMPWFNRAYNTSDTEKAFDCYDLTKHITHATEKMHAIAII